MCYTMTNYEHIHIFFNFTEQFPSYNTLAETTGVLRTLIHCECTWLCVFEIIWSNLTLYFQEAASAAMAARELEEERTQRVMLALKRLNPSYPGKETVEIKRILTEVMSAIKVQYCVL